MYCHTTDRERRYHLQSQMRHQVQTSIAEIIENLTKEISFNYLMAAWSK
jgi:hypothetical protein